MRAASPPPGLLPLLAATVICPCGWRGVDRDKAGAALLWLVHARRCGHELAVTEHVVIDELA